MKQLSTYRSAAAAAAIVVAGCFGDTTEPHHHTAARFAFAPVFSTQTTGVAFDHVRITLSRVSGPALDTVVAFPLGTDSLPLSLSVILNGASETLTLSLAFVDAAGDTVYRGGPTPVTITAGILPTTPVPISVRYSGVGSNARSVAITPKAIADFFHDTVVLGAAALDSSGHPIPGTPIRWAALDSTLARVASDTAGVVIAGGTRGVARVQAFLLTGQADTAQVTVEPVPVALGVDSGAGQTAAVGTVLPQTIVVKVKASDSLGVAGVPVTFTLAGANGGGALSKTTDTTNSSGDASTRWTLGSALGIQSLTAAAAGTSLTTNVTASALVGAPQKLAFQVEPAGGPANVALTPAVAVVAQDTFGHAVTAFTGNVTMAIGTNPGGATLGGTTTVAAVAGVATFGDLTLNLLGTGYTLAASATGLAGATSTPFNIVAPPGVNAWLNPAGGNWSLASNWSKGTVPVATDTVVIQQSGTYTVNVDQSATVAKLSAGALSGTQTLSVAGNTLTAGGGAFATNTVLDLSGTGTITGAGTITVAGQFNWTGGSLGGGTAGGGIRVLSGGTLSIAPTASVQLQSYTLELAGTGTWTGTQTINSGSSGTLRVLSGATLSIQGDPSFAYSLGGAAPAFDVEGTVNRTTSANAAVIGVPFNDSGTVSVQSGTLRLTGGGTSTGAFQVAAGDTLDFNAGTYTLAATSRVSGAGVVSFSGGTVTVAGGYAVASPTLVAGGTADFNGAADSTGSLTVTGGVLGGSGLLVVTGPMSWTGGYLNGSGGTTRVLSTGTLSLAPAANVQFQSYTLELAGTGTWTGTSTVAAGSGATLRVLTGGSLAIQGDPSFTYTLGGAAPAFDIEGTVNRTTSPNSALLGVAFNDSGTVSVQSGTLQLDGGGASTGSFTVASGATLLLGGGTHALAAASSVSGAGTVSVTGGTVNEAGSYSVTGTTLLTGGGANFNGASSSTGSLSVSGGNLGGSGLLTVSGTMTWASGNLNGAGGTTRVLANGTLSLAPTTGVQLQSYTLELDGTGTWTGTAAVSSGSGAVLRVASGATLTIQGDPTFAYTLGGAAPLFDNQGTVNRSTSANAATIGVPFNQAGALNIQSGALTLAGGGTMAGPVTEAASTLLSFTAGSVSLANRFTVTGSSAITQIAGAAVGGLTATDTASFDNLQLVSGSLSLSGGMIRTPFELIWSGAMPVSGGTLYVPPTAGLTVSFTSGNPTLQNATILVAGSAGWTATTPLSSGSGAVIRILPNANISFSGAGGGYLFNLGGTPSLLDNQGTLISAATSGSPGAVVIGAPISNTGSLQVTLDTLRLSGGSTGTFPGSVSVASGAVLEFGGSTFTLASPLTVGGSLLVSGGTLATAGHPVAVTQNFATAGGGVLQMTSATDSLGVGGNVSFGGGSTTGLLTAGIIDVKGNFAQSGNASSFAPSTAQRTRFDNTAGALQTVSFANTTQSFFDSLIVDRSFTTGIVELLTDARVNRGFLIQNSSSLTGPAARLTIIGGTLQTILSTTSPTVTPLVVEMQTAPAAGGAPALISPDTMVYDGPMTTLPTGSGIVYKSLRVNTTGNLASPGGVTYNGDLIVSSGAYAMGAGNDSVGGFLRTEAAGSLAMQAIVASPTLAVRDSAVFAGGASTSLGGGLINLYGNFVQRGIGGQFAPTGTRVTMRRAAAGTQTIQMADSVNSFFHDLRFAGNVVDTIRLLSNVQVQDSTVMDSTSVLVSNTTEALKVTPTGVLRVHSQAILVPFRAEAGTWVLDSTFLGGTVTRISPDTAVILNGTNFSQGSASQITSTPSPTMAWNSVRVNGGTLTSGGTTFNGDLIVSGTGRYAAPGFGQTDSIGGFLRTEGTGQLQMSLVQLAPTVAVRDSAVFSGGSEVGLLSAGNLRIYGSFLQRGPDTTSFTAGAGHTTTFAGSGTQTVTFANPGVNASSFGTLAIERSSGGLSQSAGITLGSNVFAAGNLVDTATSSTVVDSVFGNGNSVTASSLSLGTRFVLDDAPLVTTTSTLAVTNGPTFQNMPTTATQWAMQNLTGTSNIVSNVSFLTTPASGGLYFSAVAGGTGVVLAIRGATPAAAPPVGTYSLNSGVSTVSASWNGTPLP